MGLVLSIALGIVLAVVILRFLPEILLYGGVILLALVAIGLVIGGAIWLFENPGVIGAILVFVVIAMGPLFLEGWPLKRRPTAEEEERVRRRSLGYDE